MLLVTYATLYGQVCPLLGPPAHYGVVCLLLGEAESDPNKNRLPLLGTY